MHEEKGGLGVYAVKHESVESEVCLFGQPRLKAQDQALYFGHGGVHFGSLDVVDYEGFVCFFIVLVELGGEGVCVHVAIPVFVHVIYGEPLFVAPSHPWHGLAGPAGDEFGQIGPIIFSEVEPLLIAEQIFLVVIFQGEAGRSTGGGEAELVDNFLPHLVMGDSLAATLLADGSVQFVEVEFLAADLRDLDLCDTLGRPVLFQVLFEFRSLF